MVERNVVSDNDILIGMREICAFLRRSEPTVLDLINKEGLPAKKIGGVWESSRKAIGSWRNRQFLQGVLNGKVGA